MLIRFLINLFKLNWKNNYYSKASIFAEIAAIIFSLAIYYYTSLAFSSAITGSLAKYNTDYFTYIVVGDVFLGPVLFLFDGITRQIKSMVQDKTFDTIMGLPVSPDKTLIHFGMMGFPREVVRAIVTILLSHLIFGLKIPLSHFLLALALQIIAIPAFLGCGLILSSIVLRFGRGESFIGYINTITAFLAGAYFPIDVLPKWLGDLSRYASPFTALLEGTRGVIANGLNENITYYLIGLILWGLTYPLGRWSLKAGLNWIRRRGDPIIFTA